MTRRAAEALAQIRAYQERCQFEYPGFKGTDTSAYDRPPERCGYLRAHHGEPPDFVKKHVGPHNDHAFVFHGAEGLAGRDGALGKEREVLRLIDVAEAADALMDVYGETACARDRDAAIDAAARRSSAMADLLTALDALGREAAR